MSSEMSSVDKAIIEADKANLAKLRADEFCYYNRNTILNCDDATVSVNNAFCEGLNCTYLLLLSFLFFSFSQHRAFQLY